MVSMKALLVTLPFLALTTSAWEIGFYKSQNSCGGDWAADTTRKGKAGKSEECNGIGVTDVLAFKVIDWDDGCKIRTYKEWTCDEDGLIREYAKEKWGNEEDNSFSCVNNQGSVLEEFTAFSYICE